MADSNLVDMAFTKAELKERKSECAIGCDGNPNPYPWGLSLRLERESLEKLGMANLPPVGTEVHFVAKAKVTSVEQSAREGNDEFRCVALQVTHMQLMAAAPAAKE